MTIGGVVGLVAAGEGQGGLDNPNLPILGCCFSSARAPPPGLMHPKPAQSTWSLTASEPHCMSQTRQVTPAHLILIFSRAMLEQGQGHSRPASRRNLQGTQCQGDLRLCLHLSPPSGESRILAESGAVLLRTAVLAGPSCVLVTECLFLQTLLL